MASPARRPDRGRRLSYPLTPYGVAKAYAHFIAASYRKQYDMFTCCGILYNHESPLRPVDFLPRKVARAAAAISLGLENELVLGDLSARRDWGFAGDYVRAMWLMLQHDEPGDYIVATGESHTVEELVSCAFRVVGLDWREHVRTDDALRRGKAELHDLVGDASKAHQTSAGHPRSVSTSLSGSWWKRISPAYGRIRRRAVDPVWARAVASHVKTPRAPGPRARELGRARQRFLDAGRDRDRVVGVEEHRGVAAHFGQRAGVRRRDRAAAGHRLERRQPEALVEAREHESRSAPVEDDELLARDASAGLDPGR